MTIDRAYGVATYTVIGLMFAAVAFCLFSMTGCASTWASIKSAAAPAAGAAGGALVGSAAGPFGTVAGAAAGAVVGDGIEENASLRSGETVGEGALDNELERWKGCALQASERASLAEQASDFASLGIKLGVGAFVLWFLFRSRHNFRDLGIWNGLLHSIFGGGVGKAIGR